MLWKVLSVLDKAGTHVHSGPKLVFKKLMMNRWLMRLTMLPQTNQKTHACLFLG